MNTFQRNLHALMQRFDLSQAEVAKAAQVQQSTISRILSESPPDPMMSTVRKLAAAFCLPSDLLLSGEDSGEVTAKATNPRSPGSPRNPTREPLRAYDVEAIEDGQPAPDGYTEIEHMDFSLSAGDGSAIPTFVETKYPLYYRLDWFHRHGAKPHNVKSMGVRGDSMQRLLWDRDRVAVHIVDRTPANDHVFALILDGEACVKRLFRHGFGLRVVSDNDDKARYPDIIVEAEEMADRVSIIGRVIDKSGAGGL